MYVTFMFMKLLQIPYIEREELHTKVVLILFAAPVLEDVARSVLFLLSILTHTLQVFSMLTIL